MTSNEEADVSLLFEDAKAKLEKIDVQAEKEKKQIIIRLARDLEGKIPTDSISIEIVNQLRDRVSERFIHKCLDEKYKQNHRVENARKQKKQECNENHLAALVPLNQEDKSNKIMVGIDGRPIEEENLQTYPNVDSSTIDSTFAKASSRKQDLTGQVNYGIKECPSCKELYSENLELKEALEKATQPTTADNMVSTSSSLSSSPYADSIDCNNNHAVVNDILEFEFPLIFEDIHKYMAPLYCKIGDYGEVWFSGRIDTKTGRVISANLGRLGEVV